MSTFHTLRIDLLKIPNAKKFQSKDGSWHIAVPHPSVFIGKVGAYLDCDLFERTTPDKYDESKTHSIALRRSKEEAQSKAPRVYIGDGKTVTFGDSKPQQASATITLTSDEDDDIPF